jgi:hypothetical protein
MRLSSILSVCRKKNCPTFLLSAGYSAATLAAAGYSSISLVSARDFTTS